MNKQCKESDKSTAELLGKSLLTPLSADFNERLVEKILSATPPVKIKPDNVMINKAWRYLLIALICMLTSVIMIAKFSGSYFTEIDLVSKLTFSYVLYGGLMLLVPVLLYQFDILLKVIFLKKNITSSIF